MKPRPIEELKEIACKYKTKKEFRDNDYNAYASASKRGLLDEVCEYAGLKILERRNVTNEEVIGRAKLYETRKEFKEAEPQNYAMIIQRGLGKEAFKHMNRVGNRYYRCIYGYFFNEYNTCYIGLTGDLKKRHRQHVDNITYSAVKDFSVANRIVIPDPTQLTEYLPVDEAAKMEDYYIKKFSDEGWVMLNRQDGGNLGGKGETITYTKEMCKELAEQFDSRSKFAHTYVTAYKYTKLNGWDDYVFAHMKNRSELMSDVFKQANQKPVDVYDYNGNYVKTFDSIVDLKKTMHASSVGLMVKKKMKYFIQGYYATYKGTFDDEYFSSLELNKREYKVLKYDLKGELIKNYNSVGEAYRDNTLPIWKFSKIPFTGEKIEIDGFLWSRNFLLGKIG